MTFLGFESSEWDFWFRFNLSRVANDGAVMAKAMSSYGAGYGSALANGKSHASARWVGKLRAVRVYRSLIGGL